MKLGYLPDPVDPRDHPASDLLGTSPVPASSSNVALMPGILDQGGLNSCVGNACAGLLRGADIATGNANAPLPSRLYLYKGARNTHGAGRKDEGTYIRACLEFASRRGYPPESAWPYIEKRVNHQPSMDAIMEAFDKRSPTRYLRIWEAGSARVDAVKRALARGSMVAFGTDVDAAFLRLAGGHDPVKPFDRGAIVGGHAMLLVDHDGDVFRVANSWGTGWGASGFFKASADLIAWPYTRDLWIVNREIPAIGAA